MCSNMHRKISVEENILSSADMIWQINFVYTKIVIKLLSFSTDTLNITMGKER